MTTPPVIAIDGPAASGKSSTADAVARELGFVHVDSGALYRALAWIAGSEASREPSTILAAAASRHVHLETRNGVARVAIDGIADAETVIRSPSVTRIVSPVAALAPLRDWINRILREFVTAIVASDHGADAGGRGGGRGGDGRVGAVVDGRDIGTVVFPHAPLKIFLTATAGVRAERRLAQRGQATIDPKALAAEIRRLVERDTQDAARSIAPLQAAHDAVRIDTSALTFDQQVQRIVDLAAGRFGQVG